jgi:hypothetical protein
MNTHSQQLLRHSMASHGRCGFRIAHGAESAREWRSSAKARALHGGLTIALY